MKKHKLVLSLLLAALLVCMPLMLASCGAPKNTEITWSVIQEGGTADTVTTTAVKITFSGAVENLAAADVTVSGAAVKSGAAFTKSADSKVWTVPVTVTAAGGATVTVNKAGVKSASKTVAVHFKEEVAAPGAITWEAAQSGGIEGTRSTGAIQLTFSSPVEDLTAQEVSVGGVATLKANAAPGADSADKTVWLIPVTVSAAGNATVAINKTGVHATTKTVAVIYKAPAVVGDGEYANANGFPEGYTGTPFTDPNFPTTVKWPLPDQADGQKIPGKVMLTYFDNGGQNVAYNDSGPANGGGGGGANSYINSFRRNKANPEPDIGTIKNGWDFPQGGALTIDPDCTSMPYIGWTNTGEWLRYTVQIETTGIYEVQMFYTAPNTEAGKRSAVSLEFDADKAYKCVVTSTAEPPYNDHSYHRWGKEVIVEEMPLQEGTYVLTLRIVDWGSMNLAYLEFALK